MMVMLLHVFFLLVSLVACDGDRRVVAKSSQQERSDKQAPIAQDFSANEDLKQTNPGSDEAKASSPSNSESGDVKGQDAESLAEKPTYELVEVNYHIRTWEAGWRIEAGESTRYGTQVFRIPTQKTHIPPRSLSEFESATVLTEDAANPNEPLFARPLRGMTFDYDHVELNFGGADVVVLKYHRHEGPSKDYREYRVSESAKDDYRLFFSPALKKCRLLYRVQAPQLDPESGFAIRYISDYPSLPCRFHNELTPWVGARYFNRGSVSSAVAVIKPAQIVGSLEEHSSDVGASILDRSVRRMRIQLERKHTPFEEKSFFHSFSHLFGSEIFVPVGQPIELVINPSHPYSSPETIIYSAALAKKENGGVTVIWSLDRSETLLKVTSHPLIGDVTIVLDGDTLR